MSGRNGAEVLGGGGVEEGREGEEGVHGGDMLSLHNQLLSSDHMEVMDHGDANMIMEQDRFLPIANVARIMKRVIPPTGKIAKDAKECCQECVSEFISFITSEASERCQQEKRKTINGEDLLFAMSTLGFDHYIDPLKTYLTKYRDAQKGDKSAGGAEATVVLKEDCDPLASILNVTGVRENQSGVQQQPQQQQQQTITVQMGNNQQQVQVPMVYTIDPSSGNNAGNQQAQYITVQTPQGVQVLQLVPVSQSSDQNE